MRRAASVICHHIKFQASDVPPPGSERATPTTVGRILPLIQRRTVFVPPVPDEPWFLHRLLGSGSLTTSAGW